MTDAIALVAPAPVTPPPDATRLGDWEQDGRPFVGTEWFTRAGASIHTAGFQREDGSVYGRDIVISGVERATGGALTAEEAIELGRFLIALGHELRGTGIETRASVMQGVA